MNSNTTMFNFAKKIFEHKFNYPDLVALEIEGRAISYEELVDNAMAIAAMLYEFGAKGETIGLVGQRKPSSYMGLLGIIFSGCNFTPINPKYNLSKIKSIIDGSKVRILVGDYDDINRLDRSIIDNVEISFFPDKASAKDNKINFNGLFSINNSNSLLTPVDCAPTALAYVNYTSGSTGLPKGVMVTHRNVESFLNNMHQIYSLDPMFRASQSFGLSFDPSVSDIFFTWMELGTLCVVPEDELLVPSDFIKREEITFWNSVPSIVNFMLKTGNLEPGSFPKLTHSMFCGEQFPIEIAKAWQLAAPNSSIENLYGPTETTIYISRHVHSMPNEKKQYRNGIVPIGLPFPDHSVALIDENNCKIDDSSDGEIVFSGPQLTVGYLNDSEKTDQSFVRFDWDESNSIWYKTGDLGFINLDGDMECIGRKDNQIKIAGRRIEIGEIEDILSKFDLTSGAVVVPLRNSSEIVFGCAAFTLNTIEKADIINLRKQTQSLLDSIFFPKYFLS